MNSVVVRNVKIGEGIPKICVPIVGRAKEEVIEELLKRMNLSAEEKKQMLMVGDRKFDVEGAAYFGMPCLGLTLGFAAEGELEEAGAAAVVDSIKEMQEYILNA